MRGKVDIVVATDFDDECEAVMSKNKEAHVVKEDWLNFSVGFERPCMDNPCLFLTNPLSRDKQTENGSSLPTKRKPSHENQDPSGQEISVKKQRVKSQEDDDDNFDCPISLEMMTEPVVTHCECGTAADNKLLIPNRGVKGVIERHKREQAAKARQRGQIKVALRPLIKALSDQLYEDELVFSRETVNNGLDACRELWGRYPELKSDKTVRVNITPEEVTFQDHGIGMDREVIQDHYWTVWKFGVGALANLQVCKVVETTTRRAQTEETLLTRMDTTEEELLYDIFPVPLVCSTVRTFEFCPLKFEVVSPVSSGPIILGGGTLVTSLIADEKDKKDFYCLAWTERKLCCYLQHACPALQAVRLRTFYNPQGRCGTEKKAEWGVEVDGLLEDGKHSPCSALLCLDNVNRVRIFCKGMLVLDLVEAGLKQMDLTGNMTLHNMSPLLNRNGLSPENKTKVKAIIDTCVDAN
eukprot:g14056.t1